MLEYSDLGVASLSLAIGEIHPKTGFICKVSFYGNDMSPFLLRLSKKSLMYYAQDDTNGEHSFHEGRILKSFTPYY